jgi:hypothetical protein
MGISKDADCLRLGFGVPRSLVDARPSIDYLTE